MKRSTDKTNHTDNIQQEKFLTAHHLDPEKIVKTVQILKNRISERFPNASLTEICGDLLQIAEKAQRTGIAIGRPMIGVRLLSAAIIFGIIAGFGFVVNLIRIPNQPLPAQDLVQTIDAGFNALVLIGGTLLFLVTRETRVKRSRALKAIHELRSLAHIIDMHQLTKDPERVMRPDIGADTESSPKRTMNRFQLNRYLDYCSEMLALIGKIAALYVEHFPDSQAVGAVNDLENLTTGQSRKIWQKIMILQTVPESPSEIKAASQPKVIQETK